MKCIKIVFAGLLVFSLACDRQAARDDSPTEPAASEPAKDTGPAGAKPADAEPASPRAAACPGIDAVELSPDKSCTEMGCGDMFSLDVSLIDEAARTGAGDYVIKLDTGEEVAQCKGALPVTECSKNLECDRRELLSISSESCGPEAKSLALGGVSGSKLVDAFTLTISKDGAEVFNKKFDVTYGIAQPNGQGCGPVCCQGTAKPVTP